MSSSFLHLQGLLNGSLESRWVGTDNLTDLVAVLEEQESRHGANGQLLRDLWELIDVDFVEFGGGEFVGEFADLWRNHLARTAPGRVAVNDLQDVLLVHGGLVLRSGLQVVHALTHGG